MLLNQKQISDLKLIDGEYKKREPASIPLTIHTIVTSDGELNSNSKDKKYLIPPQGMVLAISNEVINIEGKQVLGYTTIKNYLSRNGIWALSIGIVDSDWIGPISSVLINFGKQPYELEIGDEFLRMTFHSYDKLDDEFLAFTKVGKRENTTYQPADYIKRRKGEFRLIMDDKFLMLGKLETEITQNVKKGMMDDLSLVARVLTFASVILTITFFGVNYLIKDDEKETTEHYENILVKKQNEELIIRLDSLSERMNHLEKDSN